MAQPTSAPTMLIRGLRCRCPRCGEGRLFASGAPLGQLWTPVERCSACELSFQREPGYYLLATWAVNYGVVGLFGIALWVALELTLAAPTQTQLMAIVLPPLPLLSLALMRPAKGLFLAFDELFDPVPQPEAGSAADAG